jgi:ABC-type uncharacterized transport system ATPase subunit
MLMLHMRGITKRFPGIVANDAIDFEVEAGEIRSLLGENGAGKSTLMNILYGIYQPDQGDIIWKGGPLRLQGARDALKHGISMVHQHFTLIPTLSVAENVMLGRRSPREPFFDARAAEQMAEDLSRQFGITINPRARISQLDAGTQQWVEIIRALSQGADLLILDEPTSVLTSQETGQLFETIKLLAERGKSIIFVTHKLKETMAICHRVTVLRKGKVSGTVDVCDTDEGELARMMVGRDVSFHVERRPGIPQNPVLKMEDVSAQANRHQQALRQIDLEVREGEILGIAGVAGNGQTELAKVITGLHPVTAGKIEIAGQEVTRHSPRQIIERGVGYIPDQPWNTAAMPNFSLEQNAILRSHWMPPAARKGIFRPRAIARHASQLMAEYDVRAAGGQTTAGQLSGGNLQKLILARELARQPRLIVATNPTAGLDVGAKEFIHNRLIEERDKGRAILLISADLDEILDLSDRIAVMYAGRIVDTIQSEEAEIEKLGLMMAGAYENNGAQTVS